MAKLNDWGIYEATEVEAVEDWGIEPVAEPEPTLAESGEALWKTGHQAFLLGAKAISSQIREATEEMAAPRKVVSGGVSDIGYTDPVTKKFIQTSEQRQGGVLPETLGYLPSENKFATKLNQQAIDFGKAMDEGIEMLDAEKAPSIQREMEQNVLVRDAEGNIIDWKMPNATQFIDTTLKSAGYMLPMVAEAIVTKKLPIIRDLSVGKKALVTGAAVNSHVMGAETYTETYEQSLAFYKDEGYREQEAAELARRDAWEAARAIHAVSLITGAYSEGMALNFLPGKSRTIHALKAGGREAIAELPEEIAQTYAPGEAIGIPTDLEQVAKAAILAPAAGAGQGTMFGALAQRDKGPLDIDFKIKTVEENATAIDDALAATPDVPIIEPGEGDAADIDLAPVDIPQAEPIIEEGIAAPPIETPIIPLEVEGPAQPDIETPPEVSYDTAIQPPTPAPTGKDALQAPGMGQSVDPETGEILEFEEKPGKIPTAEELHIEANKAASSPLNDLKPPTEAQISADNYSKGHAVYDGLKISIENPAGSKRRPEWPALAHHYGDIKESEGADSDAIDTFINIDNTFEDTPVFIVNQTDESGVFDEHKVMLGFNTEAEARKGYLDNYSEDWVAPDRLPRATMSEFKEWLKSGNTKSEYVGETEAEGKKLEAKVITEMERQAGEKYQAEKDADLARESQEWADFIKDNSTYSQVDPETARLMTIASSIDEDATIDIASKDTSEEDVQQALQQFIDEATDAKREKELEVSPGKAPAPETVSADQEKPRAESEKQPEVAAEPPPLELTDEVSPVQAVADVSAKQKVSEGVKPLHEKAPWEMTGKEWVDERAKASPDSVQSNFTRASGSQAVAQLSRMQELTYGAKDKASQKMKAAQAGEIQLTKDELWDLDWELNSKTTHEDVVRKAFEEGKPIPKEVLAEYPDIDEVPAASEPEAKPETLPAAKTERVVKRKKGRKKINPIDRLENYYRPGRIVPSYYGQDKVISFKQSEEVIGGWQVNVVEVDKAGNVTGVERSHMTMPSEKLLRDWEKDNPVGVEKPKSIEKEAKKPTTTTEEPDAKPETPEAPPVAKKGPEKITDRLLAAPSIALERSRSPPSGEYTSLADIKLSADAGTEVITHTAEYWLNDIDKRILEMNQLRGCI